MAEINPYAMPGSDVTTSEQYGEIKILSPKGRVGRVRYLAYSAVIWLIAMIGQIVLLSVGGGNEAAVVLLGLFALAMLVPMYVVVVKRLHDMNLSGWFFLAIFVPVVNLVMSLVLLFVPGTQGENRFGLRPPPNNAGVILLACIIPLVFGMGILAAIGIPAYQEYVIRAQSG